MLISKMMPITGIALLDAIKEDNYYCFLCPLCIPTTIIAIYINWMSLKFFKANA
jgi:hypothetical protein